VANRQAYCSKELLICSQLSKNIKNGTYRNVNLPLVLYGCGKWPLALREGHRLKVFENRVRRIIFGPEKNEVTGVEKTT